MSNPMTERQQHSKPRPGKRSALAQEGAIPRARADNGDSKVATQLAIFGAKQDKALADIRTEMANLRIEIERLRTDMERLRADMAERDAKRDREMAERDAKRDREMAERERRMMDKVSSDIKLLLTVIGLGFAGVGSLIAVFGIL